MECKSKMGVNSAIYNVFSLTPPFFIMAEPSFSAICHLTRLPREHYSQRNLVPSIYQGLVSLKRHTCYLPSVRVSNGGVDRRRGLLGWFRKALVCWSFIMTPRHPRVLKRVKLHWWATHRVVRWRYRSAGNEGNSFLSVVMFRDGVVRSSNGCIWTTHV